jgi:trans-aconitate 2-methyltransferase
MWDAERYVQFARDYSRPFRDLLAQLRRDDVGTVVDLGCGPGDLTRLLLERWPSARVIGLDASPEMLRQARAGPSYPRLTFVQGDLAAWQPERPVDLVVSNAALQWVPNHAALLRHLVGLLAPGGTLAVQMPDHFAMPVARAIAEAAADPRWQARLAGAGLQPDTVQPLTWYVEQLRGLGLEVDAWETTYVRVWRGENPVRDWMQATALRPLLARLHPDEQRSFLHVVGERFLAYYPQTGGVTLAASRRLFFVASRRNEPPRDRGD